MTGRHRGQRAGRPHSSAMHVTARVALQGTALALAAVLAARTSIVVARTAVAHGLATRVRIAGRGSPAGRYALRSVNGQALPASLTPDDSHHKIRVTAGVLVLNNDNSYICETRAETSYMGLVEQQADTLRGTYDTIGGSFITLYVNALHTDTVATTGAQIEWTHATRGSAGTSRYIYGK